MSSESNHAQQIKSMTWSYSKIKAFDDCPYRWYLKYVMFPNAKGKELFFASYGIFMHRLLEAFNKGEMTARQVQMEYLSDFRTHVHARAPSEAVFKSYFTGGLQYINSIRPSGNKKLSIESRAEFDLHSTPFIAYIDLLEQEENGSILLIDNKSKILKPRSTNKKPTKTDIELDRYLRQLYLYSHYVSIRYGKFPDKLCFNCFRNNTFIKEPFNNEAYRAAIYWFLEKIEEIGAETKFAPELEWFKCRYLCEMQDYCEYYGLFKG